MSQTFIQIKGDAKRHPQCSGTHAGVSTADLIELENSCVVTAHRIMDTNMPKRHFLIHNHYKWMKR